MLTGPLFYGLEVALEGRFQRAHRWEVGWARHQKARLLVAKSGPVVS
jgi:hypothetical protein